MNVASATIDLLLNALPFTREMREARRDTEGFADDAERRIGGLGRTFSAFGKIVHGALLGVGFAAFNAGLSGMQGAIGGVIGGAMDFEARMSGIGSVAGATAGELDGLRKLSLQLGKDTSYSAGEAAAGIEEMIKGGIKIPDVMNGGAKAVLNLAAAGGVELTDAAEIASNAMAVFNIKGEGMGRVADLIAGAANASSLSVNDFKYSLAAAGAVAAGNGQNFDDLATAIAVMGQSGIKGSDAGTSLKTMLGNLQPTTKAQVAAMRDLGIVTADGTNKFINANGSFKSMAEVAEILQSSTEHLTDAQRMQTLETIFGSDAIRAATIFAKAGGEGFAAMAGDMSKVTAESVALQRLDNVKGSIEQLKGSMETAGIIIGSAFLPGIRAIVDWATRVVNAAIPMLETLGPQLAAHMAGGGQAFLAFGGTVLGVVQREVLPALARVGTWFHEDALPFLAGFAEKVGWMVGSIAPHFGTIATMVGALTGTFGLAGRAAAFLVPLITGLGSTIAGLGATFTAAGGGISGVIALLGGPVTLAIAAVAGAVAFLAVAWRNDWGGIQTTLTRWWEAVGGPTLALLREWLAERLTAALRTLADFWSGTLQPAMERVFGWITGTALPAVTRAFMDAWPLIVQVVQTFGRYLEEVLWPTLQDVFGTLQRTVLPMLSDAFTVYWGIISGVLRGVFEFFRDTVVPGYRSYLGWLGDEGLPRLRQAFEVAWAAIDRALAAVYTFLHETFWPWLQGTAIPWVEQVGLPALRRAFAVAWDAIGVAIGAVYHLLATVVWPWLRDVALPWLRDVGMPATRTAFEVAWSGIQRAVGAVYGFLSETVWPWLRDVAIPWLRDTGLPTLGEAFAAVWSGIQRAVSAVYRFFRDEVWPWLQGTAIPWLQDVALPQLRDRFRVVWGDIQLAVGEVVRVWREVVWPWLRETAFPWLQDVALPALREAFRKDWAEIQRVVEAVFLFLRDTVWTWLRDAAFPWIRDVGLPAVLRAFDDTWPKVKQAVQDTYTWLKDTAWPWIQEAFRLVRDEWLPALEKGFWDVWGRDDKSGIRGAVGTAMAALDRLINDPKQAIMDALMWPFRQARDTIGDVARAIGNNVVGPLGTALERVQSFGGQIKGVINWVGQRLTGGDVIKDEPPKVELKGLAGGTGTGTWSGGWAWVGEGPGGAGAEVAYLPPGARVLSHRESMGLVREGLVAPPEPGPAKLPGFAAGFGSGAEFRDYVLSEYPFTAEARRILAGIPTTVRDFNDPQAGTGFYVSGPNDYIELAGPNDQAMIHELTHAWADRARWYSLRGDFVGNGEAHNVDNPDFDAAMRALANSGDTEMARWARNTFRDTRMVDEKTGADNTVERFAYTADEIWGDLSRVPPSIAQFYERLFVNPYGGPMEALPESRWVGPGRDPWLPKPTQQQSIADAIGLDRFEAWLDYRFRSLIVPDDEFSMSPDMARSNIEGFMEGGLDKAYSDIFVRLLDHWRYPPGMAPGAQPDILPPLPIPDAPEPPMPAPPDPGGLLGNLMGMLAKPAGWVAEQAMKALKFAQPDLGGGVFKDLAGGLFGKAQGWIRDKIASLLESLRPRPPTGGIGGSTFPIPGFKGPVDLHWGSYAGAADLMAPAGTPIVVMRGGRANVGSGSVGGNWVNVMGDDGLQYYYAHMRELSLGNGAVTTGQRLGTVGNTGNAINAPPHLHLGIGHTILSGEGPTGGAGEAGFDAVGMLRALLTAGTVAGPTVGGSVTQWITAALQNTGSPAHWLDEMELIAHHESRGDPRAVNNWDINAQNGNPSMGLMQVIRDHFLPGEDPFDPVHNTMAALRYIKGRYGSAEYVPGVVAVRAGRPYVGYAAGGKVTEWIRGVGQETGTVYDIGEAGDEWIVPDRGQGAPPDPATLRDRDLDRLADAIRAAADGPRFGDIHLHGTEDPLDGRRFAEELADLNWLFGRKG